jgi:hypothetical protein
MELGGSARQTGNPERFHRNLFRQSRRRFRNLFSSFDLEVEIIASELLTDALP